MANFVPLHFAECWQGANFSIAKLCKMMAGAVWQAGDGRSALRETSETGAKKVLADTSNGESWCGRISLLQSGSKVEQYFAYKVTGLGNSNSQKTTQDYHWDPYKVGSWLSRHAYKVHCIYSC